MLMYTDLMQLFSFIDVLNPKITRKVYGIYIVMNQNKDFIK